MPYKMLSSGIEQWQQTKGARIKFESLLSMAEYIVKAEVVFLDTVFCDLFGTWHHCTYSQSQCSLKDLELGFAFDGSSIKLFSNISKADMLMKPDCTTCWIDPFCAHKTLHVLCDITNHLGEPFDRCPRSMAKKASKLISELGIADYGVFGPEPEFFVFDHVEFNLSKGEIRATVEGDEMPWCSAQGRCSDRGNNLGHRLPLKKMYMPVGPSDTGMNMRADMLLAMQDLGLKTEKHHHEVGSCQHELGFTYDKLVETGDNILTCKYVVKNVAKAYNKSATFMPKPLYGDNGSGSHLHQSLWKNGINLFYDKHGSWFDMSDLALSYIGGILHHAQAIMAFSNPTTNSYKRLTPGYEAPTMLIYSKGNRSAAIRIPLCDGTNPKAKRLECRFPDGSACPYLCYTAILLAGIDGIIKKMIPPPAIEVNVSSLTETELLQVKSCPASLSEALMALDNDHEFLTRHGVMSTDFIQAYIQFKMEEAKEVSLIPHPKEFELYYAV